MRTRRSFARLTVAGILAATSVALIASPAGAPPLCQEGDVRYRITSSSKDILFTHGFRFATLDSGGFAERTSTETTSFTAGVTASASGTFGANVILAKAEVTVGFSLKVEGTRTSSESFTTGITNNTSSPHTYVWFKGTKQGTGNWAKDQCARESSRGWVEVNNGHWGSWNAQLDGVLRCDTDNAIQNQFGTFSVQYKAVRTCT
jgi:hypothetical protein